MEVHNESSGETSEEFALKLFSEIPKSLIHKLSQIQTRDIHIQTQAHSNLDIVNVFYIKV